MPVPVPSLNVDGGSLRSAESAATATTAASSAQPRSPRSPPRRPKLGALKKSSGFMSASAARVRSALKAMSPSTRGGRSASADGAQTLKAFVARERKLLKQDDGRNSAFFLASRWHPSRPSSTSTSTLNPHDTATTTTTSDASESTAVDVDAPEDLAPDELADKALFAMRLVELYGLAPAFEKPRATRPATRADNLPHVDAAWLRAHPGDAREVLGAVGAFFAEPWLRVRSKTTKPKNTTKNKNKEGGKGESARFKDEVVRVRHFLASDAVCCILMRRPEVVKTQNARLEAAREEVRRCERMVQERLTTTQEGREMFASYQHWAREFERTIQRRWSNDPPK